MKKKIIYPAAVCLAVLLLISPVTVLASDSEQQVKALGEDKFTFLLIGQDERPGVPGKRSDSMILCTFCPNEKKMILTSVLRDLYVKIPEYGYDRINTAYAVGGWDLLNKTLYENFGIQVDGNVEVDFERFIEIIDVLGGVTLELRSDEAREINMEAQNEDLTEGMQKLNGAQTLIYSRIRSLDPDGDFSRSQRQRKVLTALLDQVRALKFTDYLPLLKKLLPAVKTDLSGFELLTYGKMILPMLETMEVESQRIPGPNGCRDEMIRGMEVLVPEYSVIKEQISNILKQ